MTLFSLALYINFTLLHLSMFKFLCAHPKSGRIVNQLTVVIKWKKREKRRRHLKTFHHQYTISTPLTWYASCRTVALMVLGQFSDIYGFHPIKNFRNCAVKILRRFFANFCYEKLENVEWEFTSFGITIEEKNISG